MTQKEFTDRTGVQVTATEYNAIEEVYVNCDLEKDEFCKVWAQMNASRVAAAKEAAKQQRKEEELEREVNALRYELEQERRNREIARKKASADLMVAIIQSNAYSDEILRIHRVERGSQRGNEVLNTIVTEYKTRKGLK